MRTNKIYSCLLIVIFGLLLFIFFYPIEPKFKNTTQNLNIEKIRIDFLKNLKISGYWELSPFVIDDNGGGDYNWTEAAS
ncbi:MAG: hypothetical protein HWN81_17895 [Candidatus Lokiarchaeota archaeon]|nr:hypothetical protein [Candidatus Lokiarchaeota archaeon]